ncbi:MAG: formylglycine-generating enzyme family protein [Gammaproteobacteria bacterium]|nr:formylglycine-generating enzyme family protein [Gammaproteobacteria bacterium]
MPGSLLAAISSTDGSIEIEPIDSDEPDPARTDNITRLRIQEAENSTHCQLPSADFSIHTDQEHRIFRRLTAPKWADAIGRDRFGLWATLALEANTGKPNTRRDEPVIQRLRWIPPGQFIMGSPESERAGFPRYEQDKWGAREEPRHRVILTRGHWLFDTPCTQALWRAVMGENPSRFQTPERPVESVSWHEVDGFIKKINERIPDLNLMLPTEAQWEYACRAGTETATHGGPIALSGSNHAKVLDAIAWYGGNSGIDFELDNGCDSSGWREKQYDHRLAGTHPVARKQPNPWGLHDMLGNVWEWCRDGPRAYGDETVIDPIGPEKSGGERTVRGGSWYYFARYVRAAFRLQYQPGVRFDRLGFRCICHS